MQQRTLTYDSAKRISGLTMLTIALLSSHICFRSQARTYPPLLCGLRPLILGCLAFFQISDHHACFRSQYPSCLTLHTSSSSSCFPFAI